MSKKVKTIVRFHLPAGAATPAPPVGSALGPHGVNMMDFCKQFNAATASRKGETVPTVITVYTDRTFVFITKTAPTSELLRKAAKIAKGAKTPGTQVAATIGKAEIEEIAKIKMVDLNAWNLDAARKIVEGSARSMGIKVVN